MAGRIRTIKPEILEDEVVASLSDEAWRMWVASWALADDHGNVRASVKYLAALIWQDTNRDVSGALAELIRTKRFEPYAVNGSRFIHIRNWDKHQRVDNAGKPRVPTPTQDDGTWDDTNVVAFGASPDVLVHTYFAEREDTGEIKIGRSHNVDARLSQIAQQSRTKVSLLVSIPTDAERRLHLHFAEYRTTGEWFRPDDAILSFIDEAKSNGIDCLLALSPQVPWEPRASAATIDVATDGRGSRVARRRAVSPPDHDLRPPTTTTTTTTTNDQQHTPPAAAVGRGSRITLDWTPPDELLAWCRGEGVDGSRHVAEFIDFWIGVAGSKGVKRDWNATFRNRIRELKGMGRASLVDAPRAPLVLVEQTPMTETEDLELKKTLAHFSKNRVISL